jgi:hypothetical protein
MGMERWMVVSMTSSFGTQPDDRIRKRGKTKKALAKSTCLKRSAPICSYGERRVPIPSPEAFIFPDSNGRFQDTDSYRKRVLHRLAEILNLPKLTFQVIRRTIATLSQTLGSVKDTQGLLRHVRTPTTTDQYMQIQPEGVKRMVNSIHGELRKPSASASSRQPRNGAGEIGMLASRPQTKSQN